MLGKIVRINNFGLFEVEFVSDHARTGFTVDKVRDYDGRPFGAFGLTEGAEVDVETDERGVVSSAGLVHRAAAAT